MRAKEVLLAPHSSRYEESRAKHFLLSRKLVPAGSHYVVLLGFPLGFPPSEDTALDACPFALGPGNTVEQQDGMNGLLSALEDFYARARGAQGGYAECVANDYDTYTDQIYVGLRQGKASGTARGGMGPIQWKLVFADRHAPVPDAFRVFE